ncbi:hypothetical protein N7468_005440 [Penicillium chermesinum]|uniref:FAD/NAD(P)-binding domain-containing protein n=1 Tax=Penicillium chermesinum TaxID=63820 RepID=A0A9W9NZ92_9EURO|nr:uncharacterized protein N7468_005440 [Penicillium chermesinum]KAJ5232484.1 hypothetical protein N7468_005440 [Penicillium chermesinum]
MASLHDTPEELDAAIVGAGFSGIYILYRLRQLNLNVKILEAATDLGGTWHLNNYPGARVDCPSPIYAFGIEEIYTKWKWSELYPAQEEFQAYFHFVDEVLSISKDCMFDSRVTSATFDTQSSKWFLRTQDGKRVVAKYFIPAVGFAAQPYTPSWKGLELFQGEIHHTSTWPQGVDLKGKRVAVIGTGSTGVQLIQEVAKEAAETFVFQRTPNMALPMRQKKLTPAEKDEMSAEAQELFRLAWTTGNGLAWGPEPKIYSQFSPDEIQQILHQLYTDGGFRYWSGGWLDLLAEPEGNRKAYDYWAKRTRERIQDPVKRDLLAPLEPPHPFGTKRPSLEQDYYEQMDKPNVHLVNTRAHPIIEFTPKGIVTDDCETYEVDVVALATGYNAGTGSLYQLGIKDVNGVNLEERWREGIATFLGMTVHGFPNMFYPYGVQAPTPLTNGPIFIDFQASFIRDIIKRAEQENIRSLDAKKSVQEAWTAQLHAIGSQTLLPQADSWYMGANILGKTRENAVFRRRASYVPGYMWRDCWREV